VGKVLRGCPRPRRHCRILRHLHTGAHVKVVWKSFWCPLKKLHVRVAFLADAFRRERYYNVLSCSAFPDRRRVSCEKRCLDLPEARMPPAPAEAGVAERG